MTGARVKSKTFSAFLRLKKKRWTKKKRDPEAGNILSQGSHLITTNRVYVSAGAEAPERLLKLGTYVCTDLLRRTCICHSN